MGNYIYQRIHGHIIVSIDGRQCLLDTGCPFSLGLYPIRMHGREFEVHDAYLDITCDYLSQQIGLTIEAVIGADILEHFTLSIHPTEQMVQFQDSTPAGDIVLPIRNFQGSPILRAALAGRVISAALDTGSPLSFLEPELLAGHEPFAEMEEFHPVVGYFLTPVYRLPLDLGGYSRELNFGPLPSEIACCAEAANVQALIGTELLRHFSLSIAVNDNLMVMNLPIGRAAA